MKGSFLFLNICLANTIRESVGFRYFYINDVMEKFKMADEHGDFIDVYLHIYLASETLQFLWYQG